MRAEMLLADLLNRAECRCEATVMVRRKSGRCEHGLPGLRVAPRDPAIDPDSATAARLAPEDLMVWCPSCLGKARLAAARAKARLTVPAGQMAIDLDTVGGTCDTSCDAVGQEGEAAPTPHPGRVRRDGRISGRGGVAA